MLRLKLLRFPISGRYSLRTVWIITKIYSLGSLIVQRDPTYIRYFFIFNKDILSFMACMTHEWVSASLKFFYALIHFVNEAYRKKNNAANGRKGANISQNIHYFIKHLSFPFRWIRTLIVREMGQGVNSGFLPVTREVRP